MDLALHLRQVLRRPGRRRPVVEGLQQLALSLVTPLPLVVLANEAAEILACTAVAALLNLLLDVSSHGGGQVDG